MKILIRALILLILPAWLLFNIFSCQTKDAGKVMLDIGIQPFTTLSDYQFFTGTLNELKPNARIIPYDLITPLFTDYAFKARFVYVPEGKSANFDTSQVLQLPVGSCLIKNFYYPEDFNKLLPHTIDPMFNPKDPNNHYSDHVILTCSVSYAP